MTKRKTADSVERDDENMELIPQTKISNSSTFQWTDGLQQFLEQQSDSLLSDKYVLCRLKATIKQKKKSHAIETEGIRGLIPKHSQVLLFIYFSVQQGCQTQKLTCAKII